MALWLGPAGHPAQAAAQFRGLLDDQLRVLLMLVVVLVAVLLLRPEIFRLKATLTKWVSLDLEMRSKASSDEPPSSLPGER